MRRSLSVLPLAAIAVAVAVSLAGCAGSDTKSTSGAKNASAASCVTSGAASDAVKVVGRLRQGAHGEGRQEPDREDHRAHRRHQGLGRQGHDRLAADRELRALRRDHRRPRSSATTRAPAWTSWSTRRRPSRAWPARSSARRSASASSASCRPRTASARPDSPASGIAANETLVFVFDVTKAVAPAKAAVLDRPTCRPSLVTRRTSRP